jgi:hypothetical protein
LSSAAERLGVEDTTILSAPEALEPSLGARLVDN